MDDARRKAFLAAIYRFDSEDGELLLTVDSPNAALLDLLHSRGTQSAAVITAFNPQGRRQDDTLNRAAQDVLLRDLTTAGHDIFPGRNEDPDGRWPVEASFLVLGISLSAARALAARHNQLAFLWADAVTATPRLIETAASA
ncbi:MAG: DUF3293 domain-containing protein [Steroidobacteraceae bacterium]